MTSYEELQKKGGTALQSYYQQKERAIDIMDSIGRRCVGTLGFPEAAVGYQVAEDDEPGNEKRLRPSAGLVIDRDATGKWKCRLSLQVDTNTPAGDEPIALGRRRSGAIIWTYIALEVSFRGQIADLTLRGAPPLTLEFGPSEDANKARLEPALNYIIAQVGSTCDWLATGMGQKPPIGFGGFSEK
jgi:hypothetical protein